MYNFLVDNNTAIIGGLFFLAFFHAISGICFYRDAEGRQSHRRKLIFVVVIVVVYAIYLFKEQLT